MVMEPAGQKSIKHALVSILMWVWHCDHCC